ncbi:MAG: sensor histidine kinase [Denitratisoma sp.]|nr:sensor histidine kinase [Denitratisoma sp.]
MRQAALRAAWLAIGLFMAAPAWAAPVVLEAERKEIRLQEGIEVLEDAERRLQATDFSAAPPASFHKLPGEHHSYGYSASAFWARAEIGNPGAGRADWFLVYKQVAIDRIQVFLGRADGTWREIAPYGAETAHELFGGLRYPAFHLSLAAGERATVLVRIENSSPIRFPLVMQEFHDFFKQDRVGRMWAGLALVIPLVVAIYMLFLWGAMRDHSLLLYIGFQLAVMVASAWISGYLAEILPMLPRRTLAEIGVAAFNLSYFFGLLHARAFMQLPRRQPVLGRAVLFVAPLFLLVIGMEFVQPTAARLITVAGAIGVVLFVFGTTLVAWYRRLPHAAIYAAAWASLLPGVASIIGSRLGWIDHGAVTVAQLAAGVMSSLIFGIALAGQIRLREARAQAVMAQGRLLAAAHHDLRQPLQSLGIFIELMRGEAERPAQVRALAGRMEAAYGSLADFIDGLLELSRAADGQHEPKLVRLRVNDVLAPLVAEYRRLAAAVGLELRHVPSSAWIESDPRLLERILRNILANAVRYTQRGRILVGCRRCGDRLAIEVCDTGPGIAERDRERMFDTFIQGAEAQNSRAGFGLGLAIVKQLARRMGHEICLRSVEGRGSCFRVLVPRPVSMER